MSEEYDFTGLEPIKEEQEVEKYNFSGLTETEPSIKTTPQEPIQPISEQPKIKAAAITGGLATEALRQGVSGASQHVLEKVGVLTPDQMKLISENPEAYKKSRSFSDLLDKFHELSQQTRQAGFEARRRGVESLKGLEPISGQDIIPQLGDISKGPIMELSPNELPKNTEIPSQKSLDFQKLLDEKESLQNKLTKIKETGIESFERDKEANILSERLKDIDSEISQKLPDVSRNKVQTIPPTLKQFEEATNIPAELLQARPELANKKIQKGLGSALKEQIDFLKTGSITPENLASYVRSLQDQLSYLPNPTEADKFKQEIARNVSNYLKGLEGAEGYAKGQAQSQKAIQLEEGMREFGLGLDTEGNIKITNSKKIEDIYKRGDQKEISRLNRYINQAQNLQLELNVPLQSDMIPLEIDKFQQEFPMAAIKKTVNEAKDLPGIRAIKSTAGLTLGSTVGGVGGALGGLAVAQAAPTGTKLQELASLAKGSKAYQTAAKLSKYLGPAAAIGAGYMAYNDPRLENENAIEKMGVATAEVANPVPFTDVTGAYLAGKSEYKEPGVVEAIKQTPAAIKSAAGAYIKPAKDIYEAPSQIDYSNLRKLERGQISDKRLAYKAFESTEGPEIMKMADALESRGDKASIEYSRVLRQVASSPQSQKESILSVLNQQPAFRELTRKIKYGQE